ncbi:MULTISPECIES: hypothetical protein [unclassified Streptomyces]|uniref:hypothetical protein n=1 Tax=unclassified Streptomyces TaxID=2593676 RepID=UPI00130132B8|nr:hypothetical protein [Streptomyces sp. CB02058]
MAITAYENLQIVRGTVAADGTRTAGHGFKVTKVSTGTHPHLQQRLRGGAVGRCHA